MPSHAHAFTIIAALMMCLIAPTRASAVIITVLEDNGNSVGSIIDFDGEIDIDVIWDNLDPVQLLVQLEANDLARDLHFSSLNFNNTGASWTELQLDLIGGPIWSQINHVQPPHSSILGGVGSSEVTLLFDPPISSGVVALGVPNEFADTADWRIDVNGLSAGNTFELFLQPNVPEPGTLFIWAGLAAAAAGLRRRRRARRRARTTPVSRVCSATAAESE